MLVDTEERVMNMTHLQLFAGFGKIILEKKETAIVYWRAIVQLLASGNTNDPSLSFLNIIYQMRARVKISLKMQQI